MAVPFVSFAQNFEDVMLWRALKHVEHGFYIDVGAYSPRDDSVTKALYERGWRGINIEPNPEFHQQFLGARPRDINLKVAIGDRRADLTMHFVSNPGLSTLDEGQAQERAREGHTVVRETVRVDTLASIWLEHVSRDQPVHFLKVDVEGFERQVLLGNDWGANRPWIVVVESTLPMTTEPSHEGWESILIDAGYLFAYRDGLNRFYVAGEHEELVTAFKYPPNWFDEFVRASEVQATERATGAEARAARAEAEFAAIQATRSWRMTRPLRAAARSARRARAEMRRPWREARPVITTRSIGMALRWLRIIRRSPALRRRMAVLKKIPGVLALYRRLEDESRRVEASRYDISDLSPRAQRIYEDLRSPADPGQAD